MQRVECWEAETIGAFPPMKELSHEFRRPRMLLVPGVGEKQIIGADQPQAAVWRRLVDHDLRASDVQYTALHQSGVYIVESHSPLVGAANATELKGVPLRLSH